MVESRPVYHTPETTAGGNIVVSYQDPAGIPTGWLCPRCSKVNAPDVKQCNCLPMVVLPNTVIGPSETKTA